MGREIQSRECMDSEFALSYGVSCLFIVQLLALLAAASV